MKKFGILMLVLAIASMANGGMLYFESNEALCTHGYTYDVPLNTVITIIVRGDPAAVGFGLGAVQIIGSTTGLFSAVTVGTVNAGFDLSAIVGTARDGSQANVYITGVAGTTNTTSPKVAAGTFYTYTLTTGSTLDGVITIDDYKGTIYAAPRKTTFDAVELASPYMAPITLHIIPEPMTIVLLGLGGMFMLRRRK